MLSNKTAIITGGVRGIGKAIAEEFCRQGAGVALTCRSNRKAAEETAAELERLGGKVLLFQGDVADPAHAPEVVAKVKEAFGSIDILVNNAGITRDRLLLRMEAEDFTSVVEANLNGSFYFLRAVAPVMVKQRSGRIINISSVVGVRGNPGQANYCASKAGVIGLTLSAAKELGRRGITVNAIAPGYIDTEMTGVLTEEQKKNMVEAISLGRPGTGADIAKLVSFLASDGAGYITGQVIGVDGGMSL